LDQPELIQLAYLQAQRLLPEIIRMLSEWDLLPLEKVVLQWALLILPPETFHLPSDITQNHWENIARHWDLALKQVTTTQPPWDYFRSLTAIVQQLWAKAHWLQVICPLQWVM